MVVTHTTRSFIDYRMELYKNGTWLATDVVDDFYGTFACTIQYHTVGGLEAVTQTPRVAPKTCGIFVIGIFVLRFAVNLSCKKTLG